MDKNITLIVAAIILAGGMWLGATQVNVDSGSDNVGGVPGVALYPETTLTNTFSIPASASTTGGYTLSVAETGSTVFIDYGSTTITLPSVRDEINYKFVVTSALTDSNVVIDSAEGDNIEGTLIVAGAVVECDAVDQINIVIDGENIGDYVEVYSDGSQWLIGDSGVLTAGKMTCTDPS